MMPATCTWSRVGWRTTRVFSRRPLDACRRATNKVRERARVSPSVARKTMRARGAAISPLARRTVSCPALLQLIGLGRSSQGASPGPRPVFPLVGWRGLGVYLKEF
jgi:hypothetical protein